MIAIAVSRADAASERIGEQLLELESWERDRDDDRTDADGGGTVYRTDGFELRTFDDLHLHLDGVADAFDAEPELLVFPSRHAGETDELLTAHFTGNFGPAEHGGDDRSLAAACPNAHREVVRALDEHAPDDYEVGMECTHHGPSHVGAPSMFVEIGSAEPQWNDPDAARAVARAILDVVEADAHAERTLVGFGGGHYVPRFERILRETDWAIGHVGADWCLEEMGLLDRHDRVIETAFELSGASYAVVEGSKPSLEATIEELGYRVVSETWVREVDGVALSLVDAVEDALGAVEEGTRFGALAAGHDGEFAVVDLPTGLLEEALSVDADAATAAVESTTIAYDTDQNGTRVAPAVAVPTADDRGAVVEALLDVLREEYDAIERENGAVVVHETVFDPALAADHGVPEGPKFGRLTDGESVTIDGRTVAPEDVHDERTRRIDL